MTGGAGRKVVVAHHYDATTLPKALVAGVPDIVELCALPEHASWTMPPEAEILIVAREQVRPTPASPPRGWPGNVRWIQLQTTGVDRVPHWLLAGPPVTCGRGTNSAAISEFALAAMLAFEKRLPDVWISRAAEWRPVSLGGLIGKTLGLIGIGTIGMAIAEKARAFDMRVLACRHTANVGAPAGVTIADFETVLAEADHIVIAAPLTEATSGLFNHAAFARMKAGAHLVNVSRGGIVDQDALLEALDTGRLAAATLDVATPEPLPDGHPLYTHPKVRISPHTSWSGAPSAFVSLFLANLHRYLAGDPLEGLVTVERGY